MALSVKQRKVKMLDRLTKEDLEKIAKIEGISTEGEKEDLVNRLAKKLRLQRTRNYVKRLSVQGFFNIFQHELVPRHRVLSEKEKAAVLESYGVSLGQLPRIAQRDPAILAVNARPGDVIEISRKSPIAGEIKYYRVVSKPKK